MLRLLTEPLRGGGGELVPPWWKCPSGPPIISLSPPPPQPRGCTQGRHQISTTAVKTRRWLPHPVIQEDSPSTCWPPCNPRRPCICNTLSDSWWVWARSESILLTCVLLHPRSISRNSVVVESEWITLLHSVVLTKSERSLWERGSNLYKSPHLHTSEQSLKHNVSHTPSSQSNQNAQLLSSFSDVHRGQTQQICSAEIIFKSNSL